MDRLWLEIESRTQVSCVLDLLDQCFCIQVLTLTSGLQPEALHLTRKWLILWTTEFRTSIACSMSILFMTLLISVWTISSLLKFDQHFTTNAQKMKRLSWILLLVIVNLFCKHFDVYYILNLGKPVITLNKEQY